MLERAKGTISLFSLKQNYIKCNLQCLQLARENLHHELCCSDVSHEGKTIGSPLRILSFALSSNIGVVWSRRLVSTTYPPFSRNLSSKPTRRSIYHSNEIQPSTYLPSSSRDDEISFSYDEHLQNEHSSSHRVGVMVYTGVLQLSRLRQTTWSNTSIEHS